MPEILKEASVVRITASLLSSYDLLLADSAEALLRSDGWYVAERKHDTVSMTYLLVMRKNRLAELKAYLKEIPR